MLYVWPVSANRPAHAGKTRQTPRPRRTCDGRRTRCRTPCGASHSASGDRSGPQAAPGAEHGRTGEGDHRSAALGAHGVTPAATPAKGNSMDVGFDVDTFQLVLLSRGDRVDELDEATIDRLGNGFRRRSA